jgi:hypothetical protein
MRTRIRNIAVLGALLLGTCGWALAQAADAAPERAVVPLSNPNLAAKIKVSVMRGSVTVKAYEGKEIVVEARTREKALSEHYLRGRYAEGQLAYALAAEKGLAAPPAPPAPAAPPAREAQLKELQAQHEAQEKKLAEQAVLARRLSRDLLGDRRADEGARREEQEKKAAGLKRLSASTSGLEIEEDNNVVRIGTAGLMVATDLVIQVPATAALEVRSMMDGIVVVEGVGGEIDINNVNGPVTLKNVSGTTLVHTVNGDIEASLTRIAADKPLSFSTMQGDIDVTLPANVKANLKMKSDQGEIFTDFDVNLTRRPARSEAPERTERGTYRIAFDRSLLGTVNGGGPEVSFTTFAGNIYIRKGK